MKTMKLVVFLTALALGSAAKCDQSLFDFVSAAGEDGILTGKEALDYLTHKYEVHETNHDLIRGGLGYHWKNVDGNKDGVVSRREFNKYANKAHLCAHFKDMHNFLTEHKETFKRHEKETDLHHLTAKDAHDFVAEAHGHRVQEHQGLKHNELLVRLLHAEENLCDQTLFDFEEAAGPDGKLTPAEAAKFINNKYGIHETNHDVIHGAVAYHFPNADANGDGHVSFKEFGNYINQSHTCEHFKFGNNWLRENKDIFSKHESESWLKHANKELAKHHVGRHHEKIRRIHAGESWSSDSGSGSGSGSSNASD